MGDLGEEWELRNSQCKGVVVGVVIVAKFDHSVRTKGTRRDEG